MRDFIRNLILAGLATTVTLFIQRLLNTYNIINTESTFIDFISYVVIFVVIFTILDRWIDKGAGLFEKSKK